MPPKTGFQKRRVRAQKNAELKTYEVLSIDFYPDKMVGTCIVIYKYS